MITKTYLTKFNIAIRSAAIVALFTASVLVMTATPKGDASAKSESAVVKIDSLVAHPDSEKASANADAVAQPPKAPARFDAPSGTNVSCTATAGTMGPTLYANLGAAFAAINAGTHQGDITCDIVADTVEAASAVLNNSGAGAALYTSVLVRPSGGPRKISGSIVGAVIKLNGADNVTIDGRIAGAGRNLTVSNTSTATATAAIWLASVAAGNGASMNTIRNLEIAAGATAATGTSVTFGVYMGGTTISLTATDGNDNDSNSFIANRITRCRIGIATRGVTTNNNLGLVISDNIVGPDSFGADEIGATGIFLQSDTGAVISGNTVQFVGGALANTTSGADRCGICVGSASWSATASTTITSGDYTVTKNIIHDVVEERTFSAIGIQLATTRSGPPTNNLVANNFIYNLRANGTAGDQVVGIGIANGNTDTVVFNSISITGDMDPGAAASSSQYGNAIRIPGANAANNANFLVENNSIYLDVNSNTATVHFYAITLNSAAYSFGTGALNNNNYFINAGNAQLRTGGLASVTGGATTTEFTTLAAWQAALTTPQDAASIQADPLHFGNTTNLHIPTNSPNVDAGVAAAGIADDIDMQARPNGGGFDIGADEAYASPGTLQFSSATYTVSETAVTATITVTRSVGANGAVSVDYATAAGSATGGAACGGSVDYVDAMGTLMWADLETTPKTFMITVCADGVFEAAETVNLALSNPTGGATLGSPSSAVLTITDAGSTFSGSYNVGTGQTATSLTNPGGMFDAMNNGTLTGAVTLNITSDLTGETGAIALNENAGGFAVLIKPSGAARTITGSSGTNIIRINGADSVTINGSTTALSASEVGGNPALRELTVQNTNTAATAGAVIAATEGTNGAQNFTLKNVNVIGQDPTQTLIGVHIGGNSIGTSPLTANNINARVENCAFQKAFIGVFNNGISAASPNTGCVITMNDLSSTGANRLRRGGLFFFNQNGIQVTENSIGGISTDESADAIGIIAGNQGISTTVVTGGGVSNAVISGNKINGVAGTSVVGFSAAGICIAGDPAGPNTISNNMITGITAPATSPDLVAGIFVTGVTGSDTRVYHNSVSMTGDRGAVASQIGSYGIAITGATTPLVDLKDNIFYTTQTSGGGANAKSYVLGTQAPTTTMANLTSDFNDFFGSGANFSGFRTAGLAATGTDFANLAAWQAASGKDAMSLEADPLFVDPTANLHIGCTSPVVNAGMSVGGITTDFDGQMRDAMVDIGADELVAPVAISVVSRKDHAGMPFDVPLPGIEPRSGGAMGDFQVVFTFASPVSFSSASTSAGTVSMTSGSGTSTITVDLTGVPNATNVTITLNCATDGIGEGSGSVSATMGVLLGDTNDNGAVSSADVSQTKSRLGTVIDGTNFRSDVNVSGTFTASDVSIVKSSIGTGLP